MKWRKKNKFLREKLNEIISNFSLYIFFFSRFFVGTDDPQQQQNPWLRSSQPRPLIVRNFATASSPYARTPNDRLARVNATMECRTGRPFTRPCCQLHRDGPREWWGRTVLSNQSVNHPGSHGAGSGQSARYPVSNECRGGSAHLIWQPDPTCRRW